MGKLEMQQCILGTVRTNCYFLKNKETGELLIVDAADHPQKIEEMIARMHGTPVGILLTHGHYDHILAVNALREAYDLKIYACEAERELLEDASLNLSALLGRACTIKPDVWLSDSEVFTAAGFEIQALHTPGHTKGSCCYYFKEQELLISGDTLFCESVGRSDLPTGSMGELVRSVRGLLSALPDETEVYPGHEAMTTIGHEKRYNPFV